MDQTLADNSIRGHKNLFFHGLFSKDFNLASITQTGAANLDFEAEVLKFD